MDPGDAPPAGLDERARLGHEHEGVPRCSGGQARARCVRGRLLDESMDRPDGVLPARPSIGPGSIHPYSVSGAVAGTPRRTMRPGFSSTKAAAWATWLMKASSSRMRWSDGKTATVAPGARLRIQCAGRSTPAAVPRSADWSRMVAPWPGIAAARWAAWLSTLTTTVRWTGMRSAARSRVRWSKERDPVSVTYCLGRSSPQMTRVRGRRRIPSPPARTTPQSSPVGESSGPELSAAGRSISWLVS